MENEEIKYCECGCGEPVKRDRRGKLNRFIIFHAIRLNNPAKTEAFKERMTGENNPSKRPEVRKKISKAVKGKNTGDSNHMKQDKYRKLFSEMNSGSGNAMWGKKCPEQSRRMKENNPMYNKENAIKTHDQRMKLSQSIKKKQGIDENHILWNEFISPIQEKIRKLVEYKKWRENVYKKDNYVCQDCGYEKGGILNAHHNNIFFYQILIDNNIKTIEEAKSCDKLWDINNGITLCKECHIKRHLKNKDID
jgi:5-methylcytosine-specific restriction endonuclease McrA